MMLGRILLLAAIDAVAQGGDPQPGSLPVSDWYVQIDNDVEGAAQNSYAPRAHAAGAGSSRTAAI